MKGATVRAMFISIHAPRTGSDVVLATNLRNLKFISIHAPRTGSDDERGGIAGEVAEFQSTLPARGATFVVGKPFSWCHISIHAPRTGSDRSAGLPAPVRDHFNPRSPHGERLLGHGVAASVLGDFNPRSPHGERPCSNQRILCNVIFQSTLPARGATARYFIVRRRESDFNPRSPHGERREVVLRSVVLLGISIHAPRTGSDFTRRRACTDAPLFQSTLPARGATPVWIEDGKYNYISIHAPRTGSDKVILIVWACASLFQSTLPARGATGERFNNAKRI